MRFLKRPGLWAAALAVVFAFTIGGPLHTFESFPEDDELVVSNAAPADEPVRPVQQSGSSGGQAVAATEGTGSPAAGAAAQAEAGGAVEAAARAGADVDVAVAAAGEADPADAVGGPSEIEAASVPLRPTVTSYTVRRGDTLSEIALRFKISPLTIMASNDLTSANTLRQGQELRILSVDGAIHEVKSGESLWEIAQMYRTSVDEIVELNGIANPNRIRPSQELVIPGVKAAEIGSSLRSDRLVGADGRLLAAFDWPVRGRVSSNYGMRWGRMHHGMDIAVNTGTPVRAAAKGRVTFAGMNGGYGNLVVIDHGDGVETRYAHNSRIVVKVGEYVNRGQLVAYSGNTGNSTGPHLHFEIRYKGNSVDPRSYLR